MTQIQSLQVYGLPRDMFFCRAALCIKIGSFEQGKPQNSRNGAGQASLQKSEKPLINLIASTIRENKTSKIVLNNNICRQSIRA